MKELSIEEKAKRYDEAIKIAKEELKEADAIEYNLPDSAHAIRTTVYSLFSELKESEDERIRKSLIDMLKNDEKCYLKEIAWLEKQGEHANFRNKIQIGDKVTRNKDGVLVNLSQLNRVAKKDEKQGEQKPADKVEPKFKKE